MFVNFACALSIFAYALSAFACFACALSAFSCFACALSNFAYALSIFACALHIGCQILLMHFHMPLVCFELLLMHNQTETFALFLCFFVEIHWFIVATPPPVSLGTPVPPSPLKVLHEPPPAPSPSPNLLFSSVNLPTPTSTIPADFSTSGGVQGRVGDPPGGGPRSKYQGKLCLFLPGVVLMSTGGGSDTHRERS